MRCFGDVELMFYLNSITIVACVHCRALLLSRDLIDHMSECVNFPLSCLRQLNIDFLKPQGRTCREVRLLRPS